MRDLIRLIGLYRSYWAWIALSLAISTVATLANIGLMATSGWFITAMGLAGVTTHAMNFFTPAALIRLFAILRTGGRYADRLVSHEATFRLLASLRSWLFARLVPLAPAALDDLRSGDLMTRLKSDIDRLELVFLRLLSPLATAILTGAVITTVVAHFDGPLGGLVAGLMLVAGVAMPAAIAMQSRRDGEAIAELSAEIRMRLVDDLGGLAPLAITGADKAHRARLDAYFDTLLELEARQANRTAWGQAGIGLSADAALILTLAVGIPLVIATRITGPDLAMLALLLPASFEAFSAVPGAFGGIAATLRSARRIFALVDRPAPILDLIEPVAAPSRFDLVIDAVSLTYPGGSRPALDDVTLAIPAGTHIAIAGQSGSGKSSLAELLVRFRDPTIGEIRLGGVSIRDMAIDDLRQRIVLVPQRPHLFTATIADNLRIANQDADAAALAKALADVGLDSLIATLPLGLQTPIGAQGARLSGGEARRLAIARALLTDARIVILDEPSEGLDGQTEQNLMTMLAIRFAGRTLIVMTHSAAIFSQMPTTLRLD